MITLKSPREIEKMSKSGAILAGVHNELKNIIKPGISSWEIENFSRKYIKEHGAIAEQIGFEGYKYATCVSINDEVAHAIPRKNLFLNSGDIVSVDMVVNLDGFMSDSCWTYAVGKISTAKKHLMEVTLNALYLGINQAIIGNRMGDIGYAIQHYVETENNMGDVRELIGHGIQPTMHEQPNVPHYGEKGKGLRLREGMTLTIEPMVNLGSWKIYSKQVPGDSWEYYVSSDGTPSAQYEHTLVITTDGPKILTSQNSEMDIKYLHNNINITNTNNNDVTKNNMQQRHNNLY